MQTQIHPTFGLFEVINAMALRSCSSLMQGNFIWLVSWRWLGKQWSDPFDIAPGSAANTVLDTPVI